MNKPDIKKLIDSGDATSTVIKLDNYVSLLSEYGERMDNLTGPQRVFYLNQNLEREVNNGGFHQFFFNSSGDNADETVAALESVGAHNAAELLRQAIAKFPGGKVSGDQDERQVLMVDLFSDGAFEDLDGKFFAYEDPLTDLNFEWISKNAADF